MSADPRDAELEALRAQVASQMSQMQEHEEELKRMAAAAAAAEEAAAASRPGNKPARRRSSGGASQPEQRRRSSIDDEDAPRMVWSAEKEEVPPRSQESMARRMMKKIGMGSGKSSGEGGGGARGFSMTRALGMGGGGGDDPDRPRGPSLSRMMGLVDKDGAAVDPRGGSIGRLVFSANSDGKLKAFRGVRKLASRTRKALKGGSGSRDAELTEEQKAAELQEAMRVQANLQRQDSNQQQQDPGSPSSEDGGGSGKRQAPEDKLMAAVGARRREWQMVYSHLYMKGLGMGALVDRLLKCGITLADYYSLAVEDEDADAQEMGFEDAEEMLDQDSILAQIENDDDDDDSDEDDDDDEKLEKKANKASKASVSSSSSTTAGLSASMQAVMASSKKKSTLDEDLAIDTGCTVAEARKLRHAVMAFYKAEKSLGFLKGHGFDGVLERILKLGLLPDDVRSDALEDDKELRELLLNEGGLPDDVIDALGRALKQYDRVQAALNEFDSLSMSDECTFTMNLGLPMGLRLDDDTLVVLSVEAGGQAEASGVPVGARILAVGGETVTVVEDAIAALKRLRDTGSLEASVVYREFKVEPTPEEKAAADAANQLASATAAQETARKQQTATASQDGGDGGGGERGYVAPSAAAVLNDESQADLPGMDQVELPGMSAAVSDDSISVGVTSPPVRRRSSVGGPMAVDGRRASHILTQTILHEKRTLSSGTNLVTEERLQELLNELSDEKLDNSGKVRHLVSSLVDELFTAAQIVKLCGCTPSVKTHHLFMEVLVPRCVDPSEGSSTILALFRFQEDKEIVHEALKIRLSSLKAGMQLVASQGGSGAFVSKDGTNAAGASAAAIAIAGVTYNAGGGAKRRGSLGGGVGGSIGGGGVSRDGSGLIGNPLLNKMKAQSRGARAM